VLKRPVYSGLQQQKTSRHCDLSANMAGRRLACAVVLACCVLHACGEDAEDSEAVEPQKSMTPTERAKAMVVCKHAIWKKWSSGASAMEDIGELVNATIAHSAGIDGDAATKLNYSEATRVLAVAQLANCVRTVTLADVETDSAGSLSETAVERILGGSAVGLNMTEEEMEFMDDAFKTQQSNSEAPQLLGVQVHNIPLPLQILYMVGVVGALCYVIMKAVGSLSAGDKARGEKETSSMKKENKKLK
jgi:hypothetical protein